MTLKRNPYNPFMNIPAEISSKFTTYEEAEKWWDDQGIKPEKPKFEDADGNPISFMEASQLANTNLSAATQKAVQQRLASIDGYGVAKLAKGNVTVKLIIDID